MQQYSCCIWTKRTQIYKQEPRCAVQLWASDTLALRSLWRFLFKQGAGLVTVFVSIATPKLYCHPRLSCQPA